MASAEEPGWFRMEIADSTGNNRVTTHQFHVDQFNVSAANYNYANCLVPPNSEVVALADMRMNVSFKQESLTGDIVESEETTINLPVTLIRDRDGMIFERNISLEQMTGFKKSGTVDIPTNGNGYTILSYFEMPEGYHGYWGHNTLQTSHGYVYVGDDS